MLEENREVLDLEFRWLNPPPPEMRKKWKIYRDLKKRAENLHIDEETFKIRSKEEYDHFK